LSLPGGIAGLVVAGLLSAAMSSLSAGLSACCSVISVDFIDRFRKGSISERAHVWQARLISWSLGALVVLMSTGVAYVKGNLMELCFKIVNLFVAPLFGMFAMAMWVPWATPLGTLVGAAAGVGIAFVMNFSQELGIDVKIGIDWAMPLALAVQLLVGMAVSAVDVNGRAHLASDDSLED
jgi:Na+/proline symporter